MEKLADGRTAEIFKYDESHVLKLYRSGFPPGMADYEFGLVQKIQANGIPTPAALEMVEVDGRTGILLERVHGRSMLQIVQEDPTQLVPLTQQLADLQADMHNKAVEGLPDNLERLRRKINQAKPLNAELKTAVLNQLERLPSGSQLLHGDFHPDNVLITDDGPVIIDWIDASQGQPLADVARTLIIITVGRQADVDNVQQAQIQHMQALFASTYLERYGERRPYRPADLEAWKIPVAAGRLSENIPEIEADLLAYLKTT